MAAEAAARAGTAAAGAADRVGRLVGAMLARKGLPVPAPGDDLRAAGLSSLDVVNLMLAVEGEFDLLVPQADMTPETFRSVASIAALVDRLA